jgi:hypothetical protein
MKEAQAQKLALMAELEAQPEPEKIVGLHPAALGHFEKLVGQLDDVFGRGVTPDNAEAAEKIRELVAKVVVKPSGDGFKIELQGRPALLMNAPNLSPQHAHRCVGGIGGSGGGATAFSHNAQTYAITSDRAPDRVGGILRHRKQSKRSASALGKA